jgi:N-acetylmuramoyl-L-alanine amidase
MTAEGRGGAACGRERRRLAWAASLVLAVGIPAPAQAALALDPVARDAIARVAYAEAGDQGDPGLAGVVFTILNRLASGAWGDRADAVVDAPHQFEPVMRAGGDWRRLRKPSPAQQAHIETILNLALAGRLPDLTHGARYFQNVRLVAARAVRGEVSPALVGFGGARPTAVIGAHSFYAERRPATSGRSRASSPGDPSPAPLFVGEPQTPGVAGLSQRGSGEGLGEGMFIAHDGAVAASPSP